jgi:hypothetical protein
MRFEVFTAVNIMTVIFLVMTPCNLVDGFKLFGGTYCLHLQGTLLCIKFKWTLSSFSYIIFLLKDGM